MADEIREALARLPRELYDRPPGTVAITLGSVEGAGFDPERVAAWVADHGGHERVEVTERPVLIGGPLSRPARTITTPYFVVPLDALE